MPPLGTGVFCDEVFLYLDAVEETEAEEGDATVLYIIKYTINAFTNSVKQSILIQKHITKNYKLQKEEKEARQIPYSQTLQHLKYEHH